MHIGLLTADLTSHHGWGNYGLSVIQSLQDAGHQLTIVSAHNSDPIDHPAHYRLLPSVTPQEPNFLLKLFSSYWRIARHLNDCDVIHTTIELYAPLVQWLARQRPIFMSAHGSYINLPRVRRFPVNHIFRIAFEAAHIINVSHYTQTVAREVVPRARTSVVVNAVDASTFADIPRKPSSTPVIVTLGGVKARKGTKPLIDAVAVVRDYFPDVQCHILGNVTAELNYAAEVREQIRILNLENIVHLHGFADEQTVHDIYSQATLFVLPSLNAGWKFEGFGLATMEASAAGLPVIGTYGCGAEEVIDDGETGLLISQNHIAEELPRAILNLLNYPDTTRQMGIAGQRKALSRTWDDVARELTALYDQDLKQKR